MYGETRVRLRVPFLVPFVVLLALDSSCGPESISLVLASCSAGALRSLKYLEIIFDLRIFFEVNGHCGDEDMNLLVFFVFWR